MNEEISLIEFIRQAKLVQADYMPSSDNPYFPSIRDFYQNEIRKRIPKESEKLNLNLIELTFLAILALRFKSCRELIRRVAQLWGASIEEILKNESELDESIRSGDLKKYVSIDDRLYYEINPKNKKTLFAVLVGDSK